MLKILVPLDGSLFGEQIIPVAHRALEETGGEVYLLRITAPTHPVSRGSLNYDPVSEKQASALAGASIIERAGIHDVETRMQAGERVKEEALDYLHHVAQRFPADRVHVEVRSNSNVPNEIVKVATDLGVSFIAMATHGRTGLRHALMGSVTEAVIRAGTVPVLVFRPER
jgi:nucleotide-binding universal stress UspA family protein